MTDAAHHPHAPVMLAEVLTAVAPQAGETIVDGTFGAGGYSTALLEAADCRVVGIDRDPTVVPAAGSLAARFGGRFVFVPGAFGALDALLQGAGIDTVDAVVLDIGVSSMQLDQAARGFSFMRDGPLDMRMSGDGASAADVVNGLAEDALARIIWVYGEEKRSRAVARAIAKARETAPIETTLALAEVVATAIGRPGRDPIHPATRTFQALRIYVNDELGELAGALAASERALRAGGRLVVVTFHSLEDRIVKQFMAERAGEGRTGSRHMPVADQGPPPTFERLGRKAATAPAAEVAANPRARSAKLRAARRLEAPAWPAGVGGDPLRGLPRIHQSEGGLA